MPPTYKNRSILEIETDLINCLLTAPTIDYPWNPADPDTADNYARSDRHFCLENWLDTELSALRNRRHHSINWRWQSRLMNMVNQ